MKEQLPPPKGLKSRKFLLFVLSLVIVVVFAAFERLSMTLVLALIALPTGYGYLNLKQKGFVANLLQPGAALSTEGRAVDD